MYRFLVSFLTCVCVHMFLDIILIFLNVIAKCIKHVIAYYVIVRFLHKTNLPFVYQSFERRHWKYFFPYYSKFISVLKLI